MRTAGCNIDYWKPVLKDDGGWDFSVETLNTLIKDDTKLLVVNFPHNPTGYVPDEATWKAITDLCQETDIFLFSDEMYRLTDNDGSPALTTACAVLERSASLFGMSKTYGLPGLRIGWICSRDVELMKMMLSFKDYITICSSAPSEILSIIGLRNEQVIRDRILDVVKSNLDLLDEFFNEFADVFVWKRPTAGTTAFVRVKGWLWELSNCSVSQLAERLANEAGVLILPAETFDFQDEFFRLGFGRSNLPEVIGHFKQFLLRHRPRV
jgi:aspartate/methionine/tyrosine aminotransferase